MYQSRREIGLTVAKLLLLFLAFAPAARGDDVQGLYYNAVLGQFQANTRANGLISIYPPASATVSGIVTTGTQTFNGNKSFNNKINAGGGYGGFVAGFSSATADLGISAYSAAAYIVICGGNNSSGASTALGVFAIRGYNDNSVTWSSSSGTVTALAQTGDVTFTFSLLGNNIAVSTGAGGNWACNVIGKF